MITLKDEQIASIDLNREPNGTYDNVHGQRLLIQALRAELPNLPSPASNDPLDQGKLDRFAKKVDYLRRHIFQGLREDAIDILNWQPTLPSIVATTPPIPPIIPTPASIPQQKTPKSPPQNPTSPTQLPSLQQLAAETPPGAIPEQTRNKSGTTRNTPETTPAQTRPNFGTMQNNGHPLSNIDHLPLADQEIIYNVVKTYGVRPAIRILAQPWPDGLGKTFAPSTLHRFEWRFPLRLAKEKQLLAREACMEEFTHIGHDSTSAELAQAYIELRLTDSVFEPELPEKRLSRVIRDLTRVHTAKHSERRLQLAEERTADRRTQKMWADHHKTNQQTPAAK